MLNQDRSPFQALGGESGVRALVNRFYDLMDTSSEAEGIRALHPSDLSGSREKLFKFLCGWLGGPALYVQEYGHPRLRARHLPFPIGEQERDAWMLCMRTALEDFELDPVMRAYLIQQFQNTADHMRNQAPLSIGK